MLTGLDSFLQRLLTGPTGLLLDREALPGLKSLLLLASFHFSLLKPRNLDLLRDKIVTVNEDADENQSCAVQRPPSWQRYENYEKLKRNVREHGAERTIVARTGQGAEVKLGRRGGVCYRGRCVVVNSKSWPTCSF